MSYLVNFFEPHFLFVETLRWWYLFYRVFVKIKWVDLYKMLTMLRFQCTVTTSSGLFLVVCTSLSAWKMGEEVLWHLGKTMVSADTLEAQKTFGQYTECLGFLLIFFSRNSLAENAHHLWHLFKSSEKMRLAFCDLCL